MMIIYHVLHNGSAQWKCSRATSNFNLSHIRSGAHRPHSVRTLGTCSCGKACNPSPICTGLAVSLFVNHPSWLVHRPQGWHLSIWWWIGPLCSSWAVHRGLIGLTNQPWSHFWSAFPAGRAQFGHLCRSDSLKWALGNLNLAQFSWLGWAKLIRNLWSSLKKCSFPCIWGGWRVFGGLAKVPGFDFPK